MNELEKMKELWKEVHENSNNYTQINKEQIMENLTLKSNSIFEKLSKSVKFEYDISKICLPIVLLASIFTSDIWVKLSCLLFFGAGIWLLVFLGNDFKKIQNYSSTATNLKESLEEKTTHLGGFVKVYFNVSMYLFPLVGVLYYFMFKYLGEQFLLKTNNFPANLPSTNQPINFPVLFAYMGIATFIGYFIQKWYTQKMYGKYVVMLKDLQQELQTEP